MRSTDIFRALDQISNRFTLCQVIAKSTRLLHRNGEPLQAGIQDALGGIQAGKFRGESRMPAIAPPIDADVPVMFAVPELL